MTHQIDNTSRSAMADAYETSVGTTVTLEFRTGSPPANCAAADSGTLIASCTLPANWLADAVNGAKTLLGTWQDTSADAAGVIGHYRFKDGTSACRGQGTVTNTGGGGDITLQNTNVAVGQAITVTSFTFTMGGA